jgi:hypothetical protein
VQTPIMALFYYIEPMVRLIKINPSYSLLDKNDINNISVINIIEKIKKLENKTR